MLLHCTHLFGHIFESLILVLTFSFNSKSFRSQFDLVFIIPNKKQIENINSAGVKLITKVRSTPVKTSYWISEVSYFPNSKCSNIWVKCFSFNRVQKVSVRSSNTRRSNKGEII